MRLSIFPAPKSAEEPQAIKGPRLNPLWGNLFTTAASSDPEDEEIVKVLKNIPLFDELSRRELAAVSRILYKRIYQPEEFIFHQGDPGLGMYIIVHGTVAIVAQPASHSLAELHDGDFFGELALLDELPRSATAIARRPSTILGFFQPDFFALVDRHPRLGVKIVLRLARMVGRRLRTADEHTSAIKAQCAEPV
jgi:CRP/FNR family transcriptional regulator, cyclic AMP receptor protein